MRVHSSNGIILYLSFPPILDYYILGKNLRLKAKATGQSRGEKALYWLFCIGKFNFSVFN